MIKIRFNHGKFVSFSLLAMGALLVYGGTPLKYYAMTGVSRFATCLSSPFASFWMRKQYGMRPWNEVESSYRYVVHVTVSMMGLHFYVVSRRLIQKK